MTSGWTFDTLKEYFESKYENLGQRLTDNQQAVATALAAAKDQTAASFASSEKAIDKAEAAQNAYNTTHNDLIRKAEKLAELTMPRPEAENRFQTLREHTDEAVKRLEGQIEQLRLGESRLGGGADAVLRERRQMNWRTTTVVALLVAAIGFAIKFL